MPKVGKSECKSVGRRCITLRKNKALQPVEATQVRVLDEQKEPIRKDSFLEDFDSNLQNENDNEIAKSTFLEDLDLDSHDGKVVIPKDTFLDIRNSKDVKKKDITLDIRRDKISANRGGQLECNTDDSKSFPCIYVTSLKPSINEKVRSSNDDNMIQTQVTFQLIIHYYEYKILVILVSIHKRFISLSINSLLGKLS